MNVLSLFDGMSCGQQALERADIKVDNYFASEIDKYAIKVTQANYPNTIQLGSVIGVDGYSLPKIDLLIGGSPCQSFSFAGKRKGMSTKDEQEILSLDHYLLLKAEGFEFEGQSYLFWEYMRLLNELRTKNPNVFFFLENVEMGEKWEKVLSKAIGVNGIHINSALVSAQNRRRLYWTNIGMKPSGLFGDLESIIQQPKDKGILLKDILESEVDEKYFLSGKGIERIMLYNNTERSINDNEKSLCLTSGYHKQGRDNQLIVHNTMPRSGDPKKGGTEHLSRSDGKTYCLDTGNTNAVEIVAMRGRENTAILTPKRIEFGKAIRKEYENGTIETQRKNIQQLEPRNDGKTNCLTSVQKDNLVREVKQISTNNKSNGGTQPYQQDRIYDINGISPVLSAGKSDLMITSGTLRTHKDGEGFREVHSGKGATIPTRAREDGSGQNVVKLASRIRRLTPIECERLQTVGIVENNIIFALCYESAKNYVSVVSQNPKLLKLVLSAENSELNELVKNVWLSMNANYQSIEHTAPQNVDMQTQKETKKCTNPNQEGIFTIANNAETNVINQLHKEMDFVTSNAFINLIEGKITHCGLEEFRLNEHLSITRKNGNNQLKMCGKEIMQVVEDVEKNLNIKKDSNSIFIMLHLLNTKNLEQALIIYYLFAKNVIIGYTQNKTQIKNLSLNFKLSNGYTAHVSDSQRYKMLGNGWTVDVIVHFFKYLKQDLSL